MKTLDGFSPIARMLITLAALAIIVTFLKSAASVVAPMLLAAFIAVVATPPLRWMQRVGVPKYLALVVVLLVLVDAGGVLILVASGAIEGFKDSLPSFQQRFVLLFDELGRRLEAAGMAGSRDAMPAIFEPARAAAMARAALSNLGGTFATGLLVLLAVVFMLLEAPHLRLKLQKAFDFSAEHEARLRRLLRAVSHYMVIKSLTSLATAVLIWVWLWLLGINFAVLWGILAFVFNFIPFVGAVLMMIPAALMALVQSDFQTVLLVVLGYIVVNTAIGNIIEPRIMGRGLGISVLAVFLSLLFWGWVLGTIGVFLSVPLTMVLMIALESNPQARPFVILLGPSILTEDADQPVAEQV